MGQVSLGPAIGYGVIESLKVARALLGFRAWQIPPASSARFGRPM